MKKTALLFDTRNRQKQHIEFHQNKSKTQARTGEFWRYREGVNVGNEISKDGKFMRVCFVLHNNLGNGLFLVAPITTKYHTWMKKYYVKIEHYQKHGLKECRIILNQVKLIDSKRLFSTLGKQNPHVTLVPIVLQSYISLINNRIYKKNHPLSQG